MKRYATFFLALVLLLALCGPAFGAGDDADPVVSLSYLERTFTPDVEKSYQRAINASLGAAAHDGLRGAAETLAAQRLAQRRQQSSLLRESAGSLMFKQGDVVTLSPGCKATLKNGSALIDTSYLVDVTHGAAASKGAALAANTLYMMGDSQSGELVIQSATCELTLIGTYRCAASAAVDYGSMALALNAMGLFRGTGTTFALENGANRAESLVMFLRILGLENDALSYRGSCPFTDVPEGHWARPYVAYAYAKGLTTGTGNSRFSPASAITCQQYATFLLRALNYQENVDFTYDQALQSLTSLGLFSQRETSALSAGTFRRYQMVYLSYYALFGVDQDSGRLLMTELVSDGAVQQTALNQGLARVLGGPIQ